MINDFQITKNFNLQEFACRHCDAVKVEPELVRKLQQLRDHLGKPLVILSGYRCPKHNLAVGGAKDSYHVKGMAADIAAGPAGLSVTELAQLAEKYGFNGIGLYPDNGFVHVDVRPYKARWNG